jgi:hypothetical protein
MYDPSSVVNPVMISQDTQPLRFQPIQSIQNLGTTANEFGFTELARTRGIIFTYQLVKDASSGNIIY